MISNRLRIIVIIVAGAILSPWLILGCSRYGDAALRLPLNPVLTGGLGWGLVKDAYVRLKDSPSTAGRDIDHLRRGSILRLDERELSPAAGGDKTLLQPDIWYRVESDGVKGWVLGSELDIYTSEAQANKAGAAYR